jgi:hypothetical protein
MQNFDKPQFTKPPVTNVNEEGTPETSEAFPKHSFDRESPNYIGPIFVVHRSNNFLDDGVEAMVDAVGQGGGEIETKIFPAGTERVEIDQWYEENVDKLSGKRIITDWTCKFKGQEDQEVSANLDSLMTKAKLRSMALSSGIPINAEDVGRRGQVLVESPEAVERFDQTMSSVIKYVYDSLKPEDRPRAVYLFKESLIDHYPIPSDIDPALAEAFDNRHDNYEAFSSIRNSQTIIDAIAERIRLNIVKAGIPEDIIIVIDSSGELFTADMAESIYSQPKDFVLIDRHKLRNPGEQNINPGLFYLTNRLFSNLDLMTRAYEEEKDQAKVLVLPIGNFITDAEGYGLIKSNEKGIKPAAIAEILLEG